MAEKGATGIIFLRIQTLSSQVKLEWTVEVETWGWLLRNRQTNPYSWQKVNCMGKLSHIWNYTNCCLTLGSLYLSSPPCKALEAVHLCASLQLAMSITGFRRDLGSPQRVQANHNPAALPPSGWVWHMLRSEIISLSFKFLPVWRVTLKKKCFLHWIYDVKIQADL